MKKTKWICPKCGFEIKNSREKHLNYCKGYGPRSKRHKIIRGSKEFSEKVSDGLKKKYLDDPDLKNRVRNGLKKSFLEEKYDGKAKTEKLEVERRLKISLTAKKNKISGGLRKGSGRGKKGWYKGFWCDSSWELAYVIYCLDHNIKFSRNNKKFEYIWEKEVHHYTPDFIMEDGLYIEIKGYLTKQVEEKIRQFNYPIEIIDKNKIIKYVDYVKDKYGKDFIELYENGRNNWEGVPVLL